MLTMDKLINYYCFFYLLLHCIIPKHPKYRHVLKMYMKLFILLVHEYDETVNLLRHVM